jgi:hypothetical protein
MTTTYRNGKIARLPQPIREDLNHRLASNQPGPEILAWLNPHPDVQKILTQYFEGRLISQQNLSEWRHGGYKEWIQLQETRQFTRELVEQSDTMEADYSAKKITDAYATIAAAEFVRHAKTRLADCKNSKQLWECTCEIQNQLGRRRRDDYRASHLKLRQDRWDCEVTNAKKATEHAAEFERRRQMLTYFQLQPVIPEEARKRGGTDLQRDTAAFILELEHKLKIGILGRKTKELATDEFEEFDEIATRDEQANGLTSPGQPSEGRVPRVPNPIVPNPPAPVAPLEATDATFPTRHSSQVTSHSPSHSPVPTAAHPLPANTTQPRPSCSESTALSACQSPALKVQQTSTN